MIETLTTEEIQVLLLLLDNVDIKQFSKDYGLSKTALLKKLLNKFCNE